MKKISEYRLPIKYIKIIKCFYNYLYNNYKDDILLFTLSGSTVFENIIENISDIDFILILKKCSPMDYRKIYQFKNQFDIKIGGNIFTLNECLNKQIDYLAMYYLYLISIKYIEPIYISPNYNIIIKKDEMLNSIKNVLILNVRTIKKMVYSRNIQDSKILIKNIIFIEKDFLILKDKYCKSKKEVIDTFNIMFKLQFNISLDDCLNNKLSNNQLNELISYIDQIIMIFNNINY